MKFKIYLKFMYFKPKYVYCEGIFKFMYNYWVPKMKGHLINFYIKFYKLFTLTKILSYSQIIFSFLMCFHFKIRAVNLDIESCHDLRKITVKRIG